MAIKRKWYDRLLGRDLNTYYNGSSFLQYVTTGSLYKVSDVRRNTSFSTIRSIIDTMRALASDSQISTALSYYATDSTTSNTAGEIIWATAIDENTQEVADIINGLFKRWNINAYARDHILELATLGNLYIPTTMLYRNHKTFFLQLRNQSHKPVKLF